MLGCAGEMHGAAIATWIVETSGCELGGAVAVSRRQRMLSSTDRGLHLCFAVFRILSVTCSLMCAFSKPRAHALLF